MGWLSRLFGGGGDGQSQASTVSHVGSKRGGPPTIVWRANSHPMEVVGESHYQDALSSICGSHSRHGHELACAAVISLDPTNAFDANAVKVSIQGRHVGFLNRDQAVRVGTAMRSLGLATAVAEARISGGWRTNQYDEGHFGVRLSIPNHGAIDFGDAGVWQDESGGQVWPKKPKTERPVAAETGPMAGERVAIMGQAADGELARVLAGAGAKITASLGKTTTILVVANDHPPYQFGTRRSSTYKMAEELIAAGKSLRILSQREVEELLGG